MCVHVRLCIQCVHVCLSGVVYLPIWRPEGNPRYHSSVTAYHVFWRQGLSLAWNLPRRWHKPQGSSCLRFPSTQFTNSHHHAQVFFVLLCFSLLVNFVIWQFHTCLKWILMTFHPFISTHPPSYQIPLPDLWPWVLFCDPFNRGHLCDHWELSPLSPGRSSEGFFTGVFPMGSGDGTQPLVFARQALYKQPSP